jgi:hypothetical protein
MFGLFSPIFPLAEELPSSGAKEKQPMRSIFFTSLAALSLAVSASALHADTFDITLKTGATVDLPLTEQDLGVAVKQYTYTNEILGIANSFGLVSSTTSIFTATYTEVSPIASVLNVTDVCASITILGSATPGCQDFAFSFTNVKLGNGEDGLGSVSALLLASANVGLGFADVGINGVDLETGLLGVSIGGASGTVDFNPAPAPTPEPSSLCLMATGLATAAGAVRRRLVKA